MELVEFLSESVVNYRRYRPGESAAIGDRDASRVIAAGEARLVPSAASSTEGAVQKRVRKPGIRRKRKG